MIKGKKITVLIVLFGVLFIALVCVSAGASGQNCKDRMKLIICDENVCDLLETYIYNTDGGCYAFLPSFATADTVSLEVPDGYIAYFDGEKYTKQTVFEINRTYELSIKNMFGITVDCTKFTVLRSKHISALFIQIHNGTLNAVHTDINTKKTGTVCAITADGNIYYNGEFKSLSGRGNSSWEKNKKPYNLDFINEVNLTGIGGAREYALIASAVEESNLRNKIVYDTSAKLGLKYSPESIFVDLYINGEYRGLYLLVERISVSESTININPLQIQTEELNQFKLNSYSTFSTNESEILKTGYNIKNNPTDITGGYVVEIDPRYAMSDNVFSTPDQLYFSVCYPNACSRAQIDYISGLFSDIENGFENESYLQYIDLESWAKYYLIQEFFANVDNASFFFYKDSNIIDSKVYAGPVWDFDLSIGLGGYQQGVNGATNPYRFYVNNWGWFEQLFESEPFFDAVTETYNTEFRQIIEELLTIKLEEYKNYISKASVMNKVRWENEQFCDWFEFEETLDGNVNYIYDYLVERMKCFDITFAKKLPMIKVSLISQEPISENSFFYIAYSSRIDMLKKLSADGYTFKGWIDENGEYFDDSRDMHSDMTFTAEWEKIVTSDKPGDMSVSDKEGFSLTVYLQYIGYVTFVVIGATIALLFLSDMKSEIKARRKEKKK